MAYGARNQIERKCDQAREGTKGKVNDQFWILQGREPCSKLRGKINVTWFLQRSHLCCHKQTHGNQFIFLTNFANSKADKEINVVIHLLFFTIWMLNLYSCPSDKKHCMFQKWHREKNISHISHWLEKKEKYRQYRIIKKESIFTALPVYSSKRELLAGVLLLPLQPPNTLSGLQHLQEPLGTNPLKWPGN